MNPEALHNELLRAIDEKSHVVLYSNVGHILHLTDRKELHPLAYAKLRNDNLIETGIENERFLVDPEYVRHVITMGPKHRSLTKADVGGYT